MTAHPPPSRWRALRIALALTTALISYLLLALWALSFGQQMAPLGFLFYSVWALGLGLPAFAFGYAVVFNSPRSDRFNTICTVVTVLSAVGQEVWALGPLVLFGTRGGGWDYFTEASLKGWHLAVPPFLAALLWLISPPVPSSTARPAMAGLIFSLALVALLAIPLGLSLHTLRR